MTVETGKSLTVARRKRQTV